MDDASVNLLARWREGDQQAATELFQRYAERLIALANSRLSARLTPRVGGEDVVQSVYCSFFAGARDGRYVLQESGDLWRLLVTITLHKVQHQFRRHNSGKRAVGMEQPLGESPDGSLFLPPEFLVDEPSPEQSVALTDLLERVMGGLDPVQRRILELRLQGYNLGEIADQTGRTRPTVRRVLERVKEQLEQEHRDEDSGR
jgi:RNA polymerase sigma-70 factor (ECF subfamily)